MWGGLIKMNVFQFDKDNTDIFFYVGSINRKGYSEISKIISKITSRKSNVLLCLATFGGDPDAGYRIGRCLQHYYAGNVILFAPSLCKSSGTLTAIASNHLIIGNEGELGPLDIQLRKADEIGEQSSGLDIFKAVSFLEDRVMDEFSQYLPAIRFGNGSTRFSADIAAKLVQAVVEPIASQIDPIKIGEHQRAIGIAQKYGELLNEMTKILKGNALSTLIAGYPSHGFVIDRKEAEKLFSKVYKPCDTLLDLLEEYDPLFRDFNLLGQSSPVVCSLAIEVTSEDKGNQAENIQDKDDGVKNDEQISNSSKSKSKRASGTKSTAKRDGEERN